MMQRIPISHEAKMQCVQFPLLMLLILLTKRWFKKEPANPPPPWAPVKGRKVFWNEGRKILSRPRILWPKKRKGRPPLYPKKNTKNKKTNEPLKQGKDYRLLYCPQTPLAPVKGYVYRDWYWFSKPAPRVLFPEEPRTPPPFIPRTILLHVQPIEPVSVPIESYPSHSNAPKVEVLDEADSIDGSSDRYFELPPSKEEPEEQKVEVSETSGLPPGKEVNDFNDEISLDDESTMSEVQWSFYSDQDNESELPGNKIKQDNLPVSVPTELCIPSQQSNEPTSEVIEDKEADPIGIDPDWWQMPLLIEEDLHESQPSNKTEPNETDVLHSNEKDEFCDEKSLDNETLEEDATHLLLEEDLNESQPSNHVEPYEPERADAPVELCQIQSTMEEEEPAPGSNLGSIFIDGRRRSQRLQLFPSMGSIRNESGLRRSARLLR